ncbi:5259_t:CDS:1, partial [Cetraspora pellucida]
YLNKGKSTAVVFIQGFGNALGHSISSNLQRTRSPLTSKQPLLLSPPSS